MSTTAVQKNSGTERLGPDRPNSSEDQLHKAQIYNDICRYEETLGQLVTAVDKFHPTIQSAKDLIEADKKLSETLASLQRYDEIDTRARKLDEEHKKTDEKTARILQTLTECHQELNSLPMLEQVEFERDTILKQREKVFTDVLLDYAMKLAKFTHVPPTFNMGSVGPNNFVWPAEDAMRRGMLAIASLKAMEDESGKTAPVSTSQDDAGLQKSPDAAEQKRTAAAAANLESKFKARRPSFEFNGAGVKEAEEGSPDEDIDLDLDLFNAEEF
ncbi:LAME_0G10506g1_1 [Lachancea meyersii CBS 8951]|uniref:Mediator of RNA polymerase II transcription subunit 4 n=1 Tax=Lachancea meyersii CBS 8951 TaxID=1266667 RepID=A0A1G4K915_9SACH|nr:LAME_0G10506g1_1 [Lachancea meyersii CBS 8951]